MKLFKYIKNNLDRNLIILLSVFYSVFLGFVLLTHLYYRYFIYTEQMERTVLEVIFEVYLVDFIIVVSSMILVSIHTKYLIFQNSKWIKIIGLHIFYSLVIALTARFTGTLLDVYFELRPLNENTLKFGFTNFMGLLPRYFLAYFAMAFIIYTYYYFEKNRINQNQKDKLEKQLVDTRMQMLKAQLEPHFLFNTLNSISSLIDSNTIKAKDVVADLSDLLRQVLYDTNDYIIALSKELEILESYLNILETRFGDHLIINLNVDKSILDKKIPAFIFQPIIENSVKYGYSYYKTSLEIDIQVFADESFIHILIKNDGTLLTNNIDYLYNNGLGLTNIRERLETLYHDNFELIIKNRDDGSGVETLIKIPIK